MKRADLIEGEVYAYHEYVGRQGIEKVNARPIVYLNADNDGDLVCAYVTVAKDGSYALVEGPGGGKVYAESRHIIASWSDYQSHHADRIATNEWRNKADANIKDLMSKVQDGFAALGLPVGRLPQPATGHTPTDYTKVGAPLALGVLVDAISNPKPGIADDLDALMRQLSFIAETSVWRGRVLRTVSEGIISPRDLATVPILPDPTWEDVLAH